MSSDEDFEEKDDTCELSEENDDNMNYGDFDEGDDDYRYEDDDEAEESEMEPVRLGAKFPYTLCDLPNRNDHVRLSIFQFLSDLVNNISIPVHLEWVLDKPSFYAPIITICPTKGAENVHSLQIQLDKMNFCDKPFRVLPTASMGPVALFSLAFHPHLTLEHWNPYRSWSPIFLDMAEKLSRFPPRDPIAGGAWLTDETSQRPATGYLAGPPIHGGGAASTLADDIALELLLLKWYANSRDGVSFDQWCAGNLFEEATEAHADVARLAKAKKEYVKYQGVGYYEKKSVDHVSTKTTVGTHLHPMIPIICAIHTRLLQCQENAIAIQWIAESPLVVLIFASLKEYGGNFLSVSSSHWSLLFQLLVTVEHLCERWTGVMSLPEAECVACYSDLVSCFLEEWYPTGDETSPAGNLQEQESLPTELQFLATSTLFKQGRDRVIASSMSAVPIPAPSSSSSAEVAVDASANSTSSTANAGASAESDHTPLEYDPDRRVYFDVENMDLCFSKELYDSSASSSSSSSTSTAFTGALSATARSAIRRELRFLQKDLLPHITLFVSAESLAKMMLIITIDHNPDNPYYGGIYVFHLFIPDDYPQRPPRVKFITTGGGLVRFNPNLYHCGKVCLSLLGTWVGPGWNPATSSLTQLFTSIFFMIFTEEPFFNEPGYEQQRVKYADQSVQYSLKVRCNMLSAALLFHLQHPCPVLHGYILGLLRQGHWQKVREYLHAHPEMYKPSSAEMMEQMVSNTGEKRPATVEPPPPPPSTPPKVDVVAAFENEYEKDAFYDDFHVDVDFGEMDEEEHDDA